MMMTIVRSYNELRQIDTFEERFRYLSLKGSVGSTTFGYDRWLNQRFYTSREWRQLRDHVIARDNGCDLGVDGYEIHDKILVHHMNPMIVDDLIAGEESIMDPNFLVVTSHRSHNAIHYGDESLLPRKYVPRERGDTRLW